jgi:Cu(I)/Ag(I) efflux system membrane fusion protein
MISAQQELILAAKSAADTDGISLSPQNLLEASRERLHVHFGMTRDQIAELEQRQELHGTVTFRSPIAGTVIAKDVQVGQYVTEGMRLYQLADLSRVWVYLDVYERDVAFIKIGQSVTMKAEAYPEKAFTGKVTFIDPVINPETRTVRVRSEVANPAGELKPQMFVRAQIRVPSRNTLTIPASAVMYTGKQTIVWIEIAENTFEPRSVALGASSGTSVQVVSGLHAGEKIVASGGFLIESESQLQQPAAATGGHEHGKDGSLNTPERVRIRVDGSYTPNIVHARQGVPLTLAFEREDESPCTDEVVLKDFKIRRPLPPHKVTEIRIVPPKEGEYAFVCGMGMIEGKILVHAAN